MNLFRHGPQSRREAVIMVGALLACGLSPRGLPGSPLLVEPLSAALAAGRVRTEDLRGHEVYSFDEERIGTLVAAADAAVLALDPRLGRGCITAPLEHLWLAPERRLLLAMTPHEFRTTQAVLVACSS